LHFEGVAGLRPEALAELQRSGKLSATASAVLALPNWTSARCTANPNKATVKSWPQNWNWNGTFWNKLSSA